MKKDTRIGSWRKPMRNGSLSGLPLSVSAFLVIPVLLMLLGITACNGFSRAEEDSYFLYYIDAEENSILQVAYEPENAEEGTEALVEEFIARQTVTPKDSEQYGLLLPKGVSIMSYDLQEGTLTLNLSEEYGSLSTSREILARAGLVRTFVQIPGIQRMKLQIAGDPLRDSSGKEVGLLTRESFVENSGKEINTYQRGMVTLYFTDESGKKLLKEERKVYYSSNMPLERVVVQELIKGPEEEGHYATLPTETNILSVTIQEGICYVNFDESFSNSILSVKEEIPIYSIVNSLASTCRVSKVQFSINGSSSVTFRKQIRLDQLFEQNLELVETE